MIYVVTHKKIDESIIDASKYQVIYVGKGSDYQEGYCRDNTGDNISEKNPYYCELTGLYWVWKNGKENLEDITGLVHYRRYFTTEKEYNRYKQTGKMPSVLSADIILNQCDERTVIMPKGYRTLSTLYNSYNRCHDINDIKIISDSIKNVCPEYLTSFNNLMKKHKGYYYNMIICRKKVLDDYCAWLFPLLEEIESKIDLNKYKTAYQKRVFGFMAERLLQLWVEKNEFHIVEYPVFNTTERPISWWHRNLNRLRWMKSKINLNLRR